MSSSSPDNGTRVWIQTAAMEAIRNPPKPRLSMSRASSFALSDKGDDASSHGGDVSAGRNAWGWKPASMISSSEREITVRDEEGTVTLPAKSLQDGTVLVDNEFTSNADGVQQCPHDLITLTHLHEPAVVHGLNVRYDQNIIYTATGPVLLALNPFKTCRGLYNEATMKRYWERAERNLPDKLPPHVYAIADQAFRSMMRLIDESLGTKDPHTSCDQSILVSGESGAGKTVTTKFVMKYLAALSQRERALEKPQRAYLKVQQQRLATTPARSTTPTHFWASSTTSPDNTTSPTSSSLPSNSIESQVLQSNPILESFGNARTLRNDNSSRFGKFIQIQFTASGKLVGATIETYLLEKVRLVTQSLGERNYHVFFELLAGMPASELRNYCLAPTATPEDFQMTCSGTYDRRDGVSDKETYRALRAAMNAMKFPASQQSQVFATTFALLHASNLTFDEVDSDQAVLDGDNVHLGPVCLLLGVTPEDLNAALCSFSILAGKDTSVRRKVNRGKAEKGLEALIKATYGALFTYLVQKINDSIAFKDDDEDEEEQAVVEDFHKPVASIGVLDIFGFESFLVNSFEQLCINYCNEALQQQFNAFVLKNEQAEYEREGIEWSFIEFPENQDVLDLIDKRGSGILNILDDQCRAPGTTDRSFASDVYSKCASLPRFQANRKQVAVLQFEVMHYAGPVEYTADGFVEKNRDELPKESTELLSGSANPFAQHLASIILNPDKYRTSTPPPPTENGGGETPTTTPYKLSRTDSSVMGRMTVGGQFRRQLRDLRSKIDQTCPHYIRCLKPNDNLIPDHFDEMVVAEQLRCGGILEAVRVSRAGFTQHYPHADFVRRYRSLAISELESTSNSLANVAARNSWNGTSSRAPSWSGSPSLAKSWNGSTTTPVRNGSYGSKQYGKAASPSAAPQGETEESAKAKCLKLLKVVYRKIQNFEKEERKENVPEEGSQEATTNGSSLSTPVKSKSYSVPSTPPPAWSKTLKSPSSTTTTPPASPLPPTPKTVPAKTKFPSWVKQQPESSSSSPAPPPPTPTYGRGFRRGFSGSDLAKVGIQMGKTKVFLRHKAFETLERIRSREHTAAATKLNAIFRRYLARVAYLPIRDAYRDEVRAHRASVSNEEKEKDANVVTSSSKSSYDRRSTFGDASVLIERWESEVRMSIHNPMQRSEFGKNGPSRTFKWMLVDGIWVKNPMAEEEGKS